MKDSMMATIPTVSNEPDAKTEVNAITDAELQRIASVMAQSVNETLTAEHIRLTTMIVAATNEMFAVINARLIAERDSDLRIRDNG